MNLTATIADLRDLPTQPKEGNFGPVWYIEGRFRDGSSFSRGAKSPESASKLYNDLKSLAGKEGVFEVEDTGREFMGNKQWRLKGYPGKPVFGAVPGGGRPSYSRPAGSPEQQESIARSVALKAAVDLSASHGGEPVPSVLAIADQMLGWLTAGQQAPQQAPPQPDQPAPAKGSSFELAKEAISEAIKNRDVVRLQELEKKFSARKNEFTESEYLSLGGLLSDADMAVQAAARF